MHDAERQPAQTGLTERELEHRDGVLGRVDRDDHAVAHPARVSGPVHHDRAPGPPDDAHADGAEQVGEHGTAAPGAEHDEVGVLRDVEQQVPRGGDLELFVDLDVGGHSVHLLVRLPEQRLAVEPQGGEGSGLDDGRMVAATHRHRHDGADEPDGTPLEDGLLGGPPDRLSGQGRLVDADDDAVAAKGVHVDLLTWTAEVPPTSRLRPPIRPRESRRGARVEDLGPAFPCPAALTRRW